MKKRFAVLLMVVTVTLSGMVGFGCAYLATHLFNNQTADNGEPYSSAQEAVCDWDFEQIAAYIDEYLSMSDTKISAANSLSLISGTGYNRASPPLSVSDVFALTSNSVVEIYTETVSNSGRMRQFVTEGAGSGIVITADGYIVTNNHVIQGANKITVRLKNGEEYSAELIGRDSKTDLAVLKIPATGMQPAVFGNSDELLAGELVVAIGNPLGRLGGSVTEGILSAPSRNIEIDGEIMTLLQTSAAVNPGNSGGGLFNGYGELIGVINAKSSGSDIEGIGFAIPSNTVKIIAEALIEHGYVPGRIDFGVTLIDILDTWTAMMYRVSTIGVYVSQAEAGSSLRPGDRIISINGKGMNSKADVALFLETCKVGDIITIIISRNGQNTSVDLTLKQATT